MQPTPLRDLPSQKWTRPLMVKPHPLTAMKKTRYNKPPIRTSAILQSNYLRVLTRSALPAAQKCMELNGFICFLLLVKIVLNFDSLFKVNLVENDSVSCLQKLLWWWVLESCNASWKVKLQFIYRENWHNNSLASIYINYHWYQINMVGLDGDGAVNACAIHYMRRTKKRRNRMWKHAALIHSSEMDSVKQQYWDLQDHCRTKWKCKNSVFKHMKAHGDQILLFFSLIFLRSWHSKIYLDKTCFLEFSWVIQFFLK